MVEVKKRTEDKIVLELDEEEMDLLCDITGVALSKDSRSVKERILERMK